MIINFSAGTGVSSAPVELLPAAYYVAQLYDFIFTNPVTLDITLQYNTQPYGVLASNNTTTVGAHVTYNTLRTELLSLPGQSALQSAAWNALPQNDPTTGSGNDFYIPPAEADILGAGGASPSNPVSGYVSVAGENYPPTVTSTITVFGIPVTVTTQPTTPLTPDPLSFTPGVGTGFSPNPALGNFDGIAGIEHETTETMMGRISDNGVGGSWTLLDLFRFTSANGAPQPDLIFASGGAATNQTAYFSLNGGLSNLGTWNNINGNGDLGDWTQGQPPVSNDAYGVQGGGIAPLSLVDFELMNVLGWSLNPDAVLPGEVDTINAGATSAGFLVIAAGTLIVGAGGTALDTNYNGGSGLVAGIDTNAVVWAGGSQTIFSGGTASHTTIVSVGIQIVDGGEALDAFVGSAGTQIVQSGGRLFQITPGAGDGFALNTTLSFGQQIVGAGGVVFGTHIEGAEYVTGGAVQTVQLGGQANGTVISAGGSEEVAGLDQHATILSGGSQVVDKGGTASATFIGQGAFQVISPGGVAISATVSGPISEQQVQGTASDTTIENAGFELVYSADYAATVSSGGTQEIAGGSASDALVLAGGSQVVSVYGPYLTARTYFTVLRGGFEDVESSGTAIGTAISSGGLEFVLGVDSATAVESGGVQQVDGEAEGTLIEAGGTQLVFLAAVVTSATVSGAGASQTVNPSGTASNTTVAAGGEQFVHFAGKAVSTTLLSRGEQVVSAGASVTGTAVDSGGSTYVESGAVAHATETNSGGTEYVGAPGVAGGISIDAAVNRGGVEVVISGGTTSAATVSGLGAFQNVLAFGFASSTKTESGATQNVSGGMASNTTVDPGGVQNVASNASHNIGVATGVTLTGGFGIAGAATQNVSAGGFAYDTIAMSDGFEYVSSGGQADGTVVSRGAEQIVFSGATAGFTTVSGGGTAIVYGSDSFGTLNSGGNETVYGKDSSVLIYSGGVQYVYGAVVQPTIEFGGTEIIEAGGTLSDGYAAIDGGTLILSAGAIVSGPIVMNGGTLTIGGTATPNVAISGFALGGSIDLAGVAFHSGGSGKLLSDNVLQITENGHNYDLQLDPSQNFTGDQFKLALDGGSGTLVTIVPASSNVATSGQVLQVDTDQTSIGLVASDGNFASGGAYIEVYGIAEDTHVIGGEAFQWVLSGGFATGTVVSSLGQEDVWSGGSASATTIDDFAFQVVSSGGTTFTTVVNFGGEQVTTGGTTYNTVVESDGYQWIYAGTAYETVLNGGIQVDYGTAVDTTVNGTFGTLFVYGVANSATVGNGSYLYVESGGSLVGVSLIGTGAFELVSSGGFDEYTTVSGGEQQVLGLASQTSVIDGLQVVYSGGTTITADILSGGVQQVLSGGTTSYSFVYAAALSGPAGLQEVFSGGVASATGASFGGEQIVFSGGTAAGTIVNSAGEMVVEAGALASSVLAFSGGEVVVNSGGELEGTTVISAGILALNAGADVTGPIDFGSGGLLEIDGNAMPTVTLSGFGAGDVIDLPGIDFNSNGVANLEAGNVLQIVDKGAAYYLQFDPSQNFSGEQFVLSADALAGTEVTLGAPSLNAIGNGQTVYVNDGQTSAGLLLLDGGTLDVLFGGQANSTTLDAGGMQNDHGLVTGTQVEDGGIDNVGFGGAAVGTIILSGGQDLVSAGGSSLGATVQAGGVLDVVGGIVAGANVEGGGLLDIFAGGVGVNATVGGTQLVEIGGTASGTYVLGGVEQIAGADYGAVLTGGALQNVIALGAAVDTTVLGSSYLFVDALGTASGTVVSSGGVEQVAFDGLEMGARIDSGGGQYVYGSAVGTTLEAGGTLGIEIGGSVTENDSFTLQGSVILDGALIFDLAGGNTFAGNLSGDGTLLVQGGGTLTMSSGDNFVGSVTLNDAALELTSATAVGEAPITFGSDGGLLRIDGITMPGNTISGFGVGDVIDLANVGFASGGIATGGAGSLQISENGSSYSLQLEPSVNYTGDTFSLLSGPNDATYVVSGTAPVVGSSSVGFGQSFAGAQVLNGGAVNVFSGGVTSGLSIYGGGDENISGGGSDAGTTVNDGGMQMVLSGGSASGTLVTDPGLQVVAPGGSVTSVTLSGGEQDVYGTTTDTTIDSGGVEDVESAGVASGTTIDSGGVELIALGGVTIDTTIGGGGIEYVNFGGGIEATDNTGVQDGGSASATVVESGSTEFVSAGGATFSTTVSDGGEQDVFGTANGTMLSGAAVQIVELGGLASGTIDGAIEIVSSGGMDVNGTVTNGGTETLAGIGMQTAIESGGSLTIDGGLVEFDGAVLQGSVDDEGMLVFDLTAGGATFAGTLTGAGTLSLQGGGTLVMGGGDAFDGTVALNDGTFELTSQTAVGNAPIDFGQDGSFATLQIDGTIMPTNTISNFGPGEIIDLAGVSFDSNGTVTPEPGSELQIYESSAYYYLQLDPSVDYSTTTFSLVSDNQSGTWIVEGEAPVTSSSTVPSGQVLSSTQVLSGGSLGVLSGSTASGLAIDSGGLEYVSGGGTDVGTVINDGGYQYVLSGGIASNTLMTDPGTQVIVSGGSSVSGTSISGGEQDVFGTTTATLVEVGGTQIVESGGAASGTIVESGGSATVLSGGVASGTMINSGGFVQIVGTESGATISGYEAVSSGGTTIGALVFGDQDVEGSGTTTGTVVNFGATQNVYGSAIETTLGSGGTLIVALGGVASGAVVLSGGTAIAESDGTASGTTVNGGGTQVVQNNGTAVGATVGSGGTEFVSGGGTDIGTSIDSGGSEIVSPQGLAISTTVSGAGIEVVSAGGTAADIFIASGGTAEIANGATLSGLITFVTSGGDLKVDGDPPALPAGTIDNLALGDAIDLTSVGFASGGTAFVSDGFLNVTENSNTYALGLGAPAGYPAFYFTLSSDGNGGTEITLSSATLFVSGSSQSPVSGADLNAGKVVSITLDMNEQHLTVSGTPRLTLNDGGVASYVAAASKPTSGVLVFEYTVSTGQSATDLQVTGVTSGGWSVTDAGHNHANFAGAVQNLDIAVDTKTPGVTSVTSTPASGGTEGLDRTVQIDVDFSDSPLVVSGAPTLRLSDGGIASYASGASNPAIGVLQFDYTVANGQNTSDLTITSITLPSGVSIKDSAGNPANLGLTTSAANLHLTIDGIAPTVTSVTTVPSSGGEISSSGSGDITLKLSEQVTVSGTPVLDLNDGGTASYLSGTGTTSLTFEYVAGGVTTADLKIAGIDQTSGTIIGSAGNELSSLLMSSLGLLVNADAWKIGSSGNFASGANWTLSSPPSSGQEASISVAGTYTVSSIAVATVAAINIGDKNATLAVTSGGTFVATNGTGVDANLGTVAVSKDAILDIGGTFANSGSLVVIGSGTVVVSGTVTDASAGVIVASGSGAQVQIDGGAIFGGTLKTSSGGQVEAVGSGNVLGSATIGAGALFNIADGGALTLTGVVINAGTITVGAAASATVYTGGEVVVVLGGRDIGITVISGGTELVSAGGTDVSAQISGGAQLNYGHANGDTIFTGSQIVESGGVASGTMLSGGSEIVSAHGTDHAAQISGGTQLIFGLVSGATVSYGGSQAVESGGMVSASTVLSGGTEIVSARGADMGAHISGTELVASGGAALEAAVSNGGDEVIVSGGITLSATVTSGGSEIVSSGGLASATTVLGSGAETVGAGGVDHGVQLSGGTQFVSGTASGATISSGGSQVVEWRATASGTTVKSSGTEIVESGGTASNAIVSSDGILLVSSGGTADPTRILSGGNETVSSGGTDLGAEISGGVQMVESGGFASDVTASAGGVQEIASGGTASGTMVKTGGTGLVDAGGTISGFTLSAGATLELAHGITSASPVTLPTGVILAAGQGETFSGFAVGSSMKVEVLSGGSDSGGAIDSGGTLIVEYGGTDIATTISKGGTGIVSFAGAASGVTILSGGAELVAAGGVVGIAAATDGVMIASGNNAEIILQSVTLSGGLLETAAGGQIDMSGASNLLSGVRIQGSVIVESGGALTFSGGMLSAGAIVETASGGTAIVSGTLTNGGTLYASASGGLVQIASGAVVNGGVAEVGNGIVDIHGASSEEVSFLAVGGGSLDLDNAMGYTGKVVGFGGASHSNHSQFIDLTAITYVSGVVSERYHGNTASGVLTVTSSGTVVATIDMTGNYSSGNFHLASGAGGSSTVINDPAVHNGGEVHSANIALFGGYIASFAAGGCGGLVITNTGQTDQPPLLAHPHV